jgi:predicted ATPase
MLKGIELHNWRSVEHQQVKLEPINLFIGPNAAGKSNLVDSLRLLAESVQSDLDTAVTRRGGMDNIRFRGATDDQVSVAIDYFVPDPSAPSSKSDMRYRLTVAPDPQSDRPAVAEEELRVKVRRDEPGRQRLWFRARWGKGRALRDVRADKRDEFDTGDPGVLALKALGFLATFPRIRALREFVEGWQFLSVDLEAIRQPRRDERAMRLDGRAANLTNVLRTLRAFDSQRLARLLDNVHSLLRHVSGIQTSVEHGRVLLYLIEQPFDAPFDTLAISDGTLRLLALLTALETMPEHGLLCIEEPEHGLHPLVFGPLLDIVREYCPPDGTRQVLLTTHSPDLVDAATPDEMLVVERDGGGATEFRRLPAKKLYKWLQDFRLGELWRMRQIGGVPR